MNNNINNNVTVMTVKTVSNDSFARSTNKPSSYHLMSMTYGYANNSARIADLNDQVRKETQGEKCQRLAQRMVEKNCVIRGRITLS